MARGSIRPVKSGSGYRLRVELPKDPESGKRRWRTETFQCPQTKEGKRDADKRLNAMIAEVNDNRYSAMGKLSLSRYLTEAWLPHYRTRVRQSSYISAEAHARLHIIPYLGSQRVEALKPLEIVHWHSKLQSRLSPRSIQLVHSTLNKALGQAVKWEVLNRNPATRATPTSVPAREQTLWDDDQLLALLNHLNNDVQMYTLVCLLAATGMRRGEALALQWRDVDFTDGFLHIRRSITRTIDFGWALGETKSPSSVRHVAITPEIVELLRIQQADQSVRRSAASPGAWQDFDLVLDRGNGVPMHPSSIDKWWRKAIREAGLPHARMHDLRHRAATQLLEGGVALKLVSQQLGHSNIGVTANVYQHVTRPMLNDAAQVLGGFLRTSAANATADKM